MALPVDFYPHLLDALWWRQGVPGSLATSWEWAIADDRRHGERWHRPPFSRLFISHLFYSKRMLKSFLLLACGALLTLLTPALSASAQCRDPWIAQAYKQAANRAPVGTGEACECNIHLYNNGSWGNYNDLLGYVKQYLASGTRLAYAPLTSGNFAMAVLRGNQVAAVSVLNSGGNLVASGGGNLVASGGGNLVASGGGNLVASGGGNITGLSANTPGFSFGLSRSIMAAGDQRVPTSGAGSIIIH
jgi:hypothetical protein